MSTPSSVMKDETINITRYAEVMAHLRHFPADKHAEVIARLGIRQRDWTVAAVKWRRVRDSEQVSGHFDVTLRFGHVMAEALTKLEAHESPIESLGPLLGPDGAAPAEAGVPERTNPARINEPEGGSTVALAVVQVPATLLDPQPGDVPSRWGSKTPSYVVAELRAAATVPVVPPVPDPDALLVPPPGIRPLPIICAGSTTASPLAGTADVNISAIVAAVQHSALPFVSSHSPPTGFAEAPASSPPAQRRSRSVGTGTVEADMNALMARERGLLPFVRLETPGPTTAAAGDDFDLSLLPLETYASVSGAIAGGESREALLKRHGLTGDGFEILAKAWAQRFQREPELLESFKELARSAAAAGRRRCWRDSPGGSSAWTGPCHGCTSASHR